MAETLISPGVFMTENDLSQITQGPIAAGAAIMGPTVTGPVNIPTQITSYSQYKAVFGAAFVSGGNNLEYLTSIAVLNYFEQGGDSLLVTRVASGSYTAASAVVPAAETLTSGQAASATISLTPFHPSGSFSINGVTVFITGSTLPANTSTVIYVSSGSSVANTVLTASVAINTSASLYGLTVSASASTTNLVVTSTVRGTSGNTNYLVSGSTTTSFSGGTDVAAFTIDTLSVGTVMNNVGGTITNGLLPSGSSANVRWEVTNSDSGSGLFSIIVRRGDDYENNKTILESWNNLSLDPNQNNYIAYVIGDQAENLQTNEFGESYLQLSGSYANKSKYIRISSVNRPTPGYFSTSGIAQTEYTSSLPLAGSGSTNGTFSGAIGAIWGCYGKAALNMFESIPTSNSTTAVPSTNIQGLAPTDYSAAISLLGNADAYDFNIIYAPGLTMQNASSTISDIVTLSQTRGDNISVIDTVGYAQSMTTAKSQAAAYDNSYAATYWPWVQVKSRETGKLNFVPASTIVPAVYEYNDKVAAEWWAPAGMNRGGMSTVIQPERRLSVSDRNYLYSGKVNPIATLSGVGTVIYGQKTLQSKPSALDRVNVRRLLISLKRYIQQIGETIVFEPNTQVTRNKFLNQVNPYLEFVQQKQGLYSAQVVMDDTNNTPDVIDRNQLVGSIYLQPTRTAEFIQLDFNILPTGTSFGQ